jgi:hypothetical protein
MGLDYIAVQVNSGIAAPGGKMSDNHWGRQAAGNWSFNPESWEFRSTAHPAHYFRRSYAI